VAGDGGDSTTWAILVAAGSGERLGADRPKAFVALGERVLLAESLERLDASEWVDAVIVAAPAGWEEAAIVLAEELAASKVADDAVVVIVHDAARPLLDDRVIERVLEPLAEGFDASVPALPLADTVKRVEAGVVAETVDRSTLVTVQTPQAFTLEALRAAYRGDARGEATDCASLVEARGGRVRIVEGDPRLLKITTSADLALVESWLREAAES
jgi:2-C-methyl-D-erythritol 4-phosphate cytidylyltransferase